MLGVIGVFGIQVREGAMGRNGFSDDNHVHCKDVSINQSILAICGRESKSMPKQ